MADDESTDDEALEAEDNYDPARARAALDKTRREAHNLRQRLKELEPLAAKAREADEATKTEIQKAAEARAAAERERDELKAELLRREVATKAGLPAELAARLRGSTEAELEADAKELLKLLPGRAPQAPGNGRPVRDLQPGALPAGESTTSKADIDAWIRRQAGVQ